MISFKAGVVSDMTLVGNVDGKVCVILDDMCDTGGTLVTAAELLKSRSVLLNLVKYLTKGYLTNPTYIHSLAPVYCIAFFNITPANCYFRNNYIFVYAFINAVVQIVFTPRFHMASSAIPQLKLSINLCSMKWFVWIQYLLVKKLRNALELKSFELLHCLRKLYGEFTRGVQYRSYSPRTTYQNIVLPASNHLFM